VAEREAANPARDLQYVGVPHVEHAFDMAGAGLHPARRIRGLENAQQKGSNMRAEYGVMVSRPKLAIDFHAVEEKHWAIHARLENWARWHWDRPGGSASPMFRLYRSSNTRRDYGSTTITSVDKMDAQKIAKAVAALPMRHRLAVCWCYLKPVNPAKKARELQITTKELWSLVCESRQILVNKDA
jgi:hypothetical protein